MLAVLHHGARRLHGVANARNTGHGTGSQRGTVHDRSVQLVRRLGCKDRTVACIEQGAVFQQTHGLANGLHRSAPLRQHRLASQ
jgi:hypothetical protein